MKNRMSALTVLIGVFLVGGIIGAAVTYRLSEKPPQYPTREKRNSSGERSPQRQSLPDLLELTGEQEAQFQEIMADFRKQLDTLRNEQTKNIQTIQSETNRRLMEIMDPEQQEKFSAFMMETGKRRERASPSRRRSPPSPPQ